MVYSVGLVGAPWPAVGPVKNREHTEKSKNGESQEAKIYSTFKIEAPRLDDWIRVIAVKRKSWQVRRMSTQLRVDSRTGMGMSATRSTSSERAEGE